MLFLDFWICLQHRHPSPHHWQLVLSLAQLNSACLSNFQSFFKWCICYCIGVSNVFSLLTQFKVWIFFQITNLDIQLRIDVWHTMFQVMKRLFNNAFALPNYTNYVLLLLGSAVLCQLELHTTRNILTESVALEIFLCDK